MRQNLIVALDVPTLSEAKKLIAKLSPLVRYFKVGSELFTASGPAVIDYVRRRGGKVFLDLKFHDIPNTVASAVKAAAHPGVFMMNVHAFGGGEMMRAAVRALGGIRPRPYLIAVTVLTSMEKKDLAAVGVRAKTDQQVMRLAVLAKNSGLDGVVCSGKEVRIIRKKLGKQFLIVTPGVRPAGEESQDQKRVTTPQDAFRDGSSFIVVGRPITRAKNPLLAAKRILK